MIQVGQQSVRCTNISKTDSAENPLQPSFTLLNDNRESWRQCDEDLLLFIASCDCWPCFYCILISVDNTVLKYVLCCMYRHTFINVLLLVAFWCAINMPHKICRQSIAPIENVHSVSRIASVLSMWLVITCLLVLSLSTKLKCNCKLYFHSNSNTLNSLLSVAWTLCNSTILWRYWNLFLKSFF